MAGGSIPYDRPPLDSVCEEFNEETAYRAGRVGRAREVIGSVETSQRRNAPRARGALVASISAVFQDHRLADGHRSAAGRTLGVQFE